MCSIDFCFTVKVNKQLRKSSKKHGLNNKVFSQNNGDKGSSFDNVLGYNQKSSGYSRVYLSDVPP
jgi:hypothetical protein